MSRRLRRFVMAGGLVLLVALAALAVLARLQARQPAVGLARVSAPLAIGTALQRPRQIPKIPLVNARGRRTSLSAWRGRWIVLAPSMTLCHEVCPMTTGALIQLTDQIKQAGLSRKVVVVEATVDPWRDTPHRLRAYEKLAGVNFQMLTGGQGEIRRLWRFFDVYYRRVPQGRRPDIDWLTHKPETFDVAHTDAVFFISPAGQERIVDVGMADVAGRLSPALRTLLSAEGQRNLAHPQLPWTASEALDDIDYLMGRTIPAAVAPSTSAPTAAAARTSLAGSPAPLASLHAQASRLLGSDAALGAQLRSLRGRYPVVLNAWASWCPGCRGEFPLFAAASARYGREVAFLGVDTNDSASSARSFLATHRVSYPSYQASSAQLSPLAAIVGLPTTIFISRSGRVRKVHYSQYQSAAALDNDISQYALGTTG